MDFIISLAHFCEIHGPTSILCTQLLPISCPSCYPNHPDFVASSPNSPPTPPDPSTPPPLERIPSQPRSRSRPESASHSRHPSFSRRNHALLPPASQKSALQDVSLIDAAAQNSAAGVVVGCGVSYSASLLSSPFRTPPGSPLSPTGHSQAESYLGMSDGRFGGRTSNTSDGLSSETCANCSLSVPKSVSEQIPEGAPGSPSKDGRGGKNGSPVLRTREVVNAGPDLSGPSSEADSGDERELTPKEARQRAKPTGSSKKSWTSTKRPSPKRTATSSSTSSTNSSSSLSPSRTPTPTSSSPPTHQHTHTLTYLTTRLPPTAPSHSLLRRSCIRALSCEHLPRANKGPLFFGDDQAGYTLAFVFRLADPSARGRCRRYAFICWAGRDERRAARAWKDVLGVFERCAAGIEALVEKRQDELAAKQDAADQEKLTAIGRSMDKEKDSRDITPVSSFLSGRTVDPDGHPRRGEGQRAKGLAELTGKEELFVELHAVFVRLLVKLGRVTTGSGGLSSSSSSIIGVEGSGLGLVRTSSPEADDGPAELVRATSHMSLKEETGALRGGGGKARPAASKKRQEQPQDTEEVSPKSRPAKKPQSPGPKSRRGSPSQNAGGKKGLEGLKGRLLAV